MKRNFTFSKFRIKNQKTNLNFIDTFCNADKNINPKYNIFRAKSSLKNKIKIIPPTIKDISNNEKNNNIICNKTEIQEFCKDFSGEIENNKIKLMKNGINNVIINSKKSDKINTNNSTQKKKVKLTIPINKPQIKPFQSLNQNYVININNNINNSYQIKMQNNQDMNQNKKYDFEKLKNLQYEDNIKNINSSNQKTTLTELSDLSCFKTNKKSLNLNSINSFVNNDNDLFSYSDDTNFGANTKNNNNTNIQKNQNNYNINFDYNRKKKIYINPIDFENFCKEIEEKLNL